ncbi:hypothetical protein CGRA01v4_04996 [Colletotrichum graminicola]|nr:hypothetical protein CGRA01v4_04996 [Colletotrichum graminicola]
MHSSIASCGWPSRLWCLIPSGAYVSFPFSVLGSPVLVLGSTTSRPGDDDDNNDDDGDAYVADIPTSVSPTRPDYSCCICTLHIASQGTSESSSCSRLRQEIVSVIFQVG